MSHRRLFIFTFFVVIVNVTNLFGHNEPAFIDQDKWSKFAKSYNYNEDYRSLENKKTPVTKKESLPKGDIQRAKLKTTRFSLPSFSAPDGLAYIFIAIVALVLITIIILLVVNLIKNQEDNKTVKLPAKINRESAYEDIETADLDNDLGDALSSGEFKYAVRIKYLIVIRLLNEHKLIHWKKEKTNGNYLREMNGKKEFEIFRNLTLNFERIWYGEIPITEKEYSGMIPVFEQIQLLIHSRE
jgi:hypothetical protein